MESIEPMRIRRKIMLVRFWTKWVKPCLIAVIVLSCLRSAVADWYDVPTGSMKPTNMEGDRIFTNKLAYDLKIPFTDWRVARWSAPQRCDVVVFHAPGSELRMVKRVIGLPGDQLELRHNRLLVNGKPVGYERLDPETIRQLPPKDRRAKLFRSEKLDGNSHPVMITPAIMSRQDFGPISVPPDHYFVMGDNRDNSHDSRWFGFVHRDRILGRSSLIVLSLDRETYYLPRWERFFRPLP